ncbi:MAG: response regulator [Calditrichia bacterium]
MEVNKIGINKKVLAVDDDPFIRKMFQSMLESRGFDVSTAVNGADAVTKALQLLPDIIFLDIMMPEVDGFRALEMIRKMELLRNIPVIIVTARADSATLLRAIKAGANDFIAKPFTRTMIMRKIRFALLPPDQEKKEKGSKGEAESDEKDTFISNRAFQEMKVAYINKFDVTFMTLIRSLSQRNRTQLNNLLQDIKDTCLTYDIQEPVSDLDHLLSLLKERKWDSIMVFLESLYARFRNLQVHHENAAAAEEEQTQEIDDEKT